MKLKMSWRGLVLFLALTSLCLVKPAPVFAVVTPPSATDALPPGPLAPDGNAAHSSGVAPGRDDRTDRLIVKYKDAALNRAATLGGGHTQALSAKAGVALSHLRAMSGERQVFKLPKPMTRQEAKVIADKLSEDPAVEYAVPDRKMLPMIVPNDPSYVDQWNYKSPTSDNETAGINLPPVWDLTSGSSSVVVGIIDTGIVNHADLQGRVLPGYNFISDGWMAGNGTGRSADASDLGDWDVDGSGKVIGNSSWHGTHVAGTIAATTNNGLGVAGINWSSKILPVRALGHGGGFWSDIADGMRWAAGLPVPGVPPNPNPAKVLNLSLGGFGSCDTDTQRTINEIVASGAVVVVAAGNDSAEVANYTPASCDGVIAVAAVGRSGAKAWFSNFGSKVKIAAPGEVVLSTLNTGATTPVASPAGDKYGQYSGTSMATPHVTGVVSLMLSVNPALTPAQVLAALQATARPFPATPTNTCTTASCGAGLLDAYTAVQAVMSDDPMIAPTPTQFAFAKVQGGQEPPSQSLRVEIMNGAGSSWSATTSAPWLQVTPQGGQNGQSATVTVDSGNLAPGIYNGAITVTVAGALNSPLSIPVRFSYKDVLDVRAPLPTVATDVALAAVGQKIYAIGGPSTSKTVQIYDTASNTWSTGATKPTGVSQTNAAVIGGKIYLPGGMQGSVPTNVLEIYDPASDQWSSGAPLPLALRGVAVEAVNGKLYLIGGGDGQKTYRTLYIYDPSSNTWSQGANMGDYGRSMMGSGVIDGKIYAFGGWNGAGVVTAQAQVYDPSSNTWSDLRWMSEPRIYFGSAVLNGKLYAIGGVNDVGSVAKLNDALVYDPVTDTWSEAPFLLNQAREGLKAVTVDGLVYAMGGSYIVTNGIYYQGQTSDVNERYGSLNPVDGVCGGANGGFFTAPPRSGLCSSGWPSSLSGAGPWQWSCSGSNGGASSSCSAYSAPSITTTTLPTGRRGSSYVATLTATGGTPPLTWSLASGTLPTGLTLNPSSGVISGVPAYSAALSSFTAQVKDSMNAVASKSLTLNFKLPAARLSRLTSYSVYYDVIQSAYNASSTGEGIEMINTVQFTENLACNLGVSVTLTGGFDDGYTATSGNTVINGKLTVSNGKVKLNGITFR